MKPKNLKFRSNFLLKNLKLATLLLNALGSPKFDVKKTVAAHINLCALTVEYVLFKPIKQTVVNRAKDKQPSKQKRQLQALH